MKNWKTTTLGILTIVGAMVAAAQAALQTGHFDWGAIAPQLTAGWALIHAADAAPPSAGMTNDKNRMTKAGAIALALTCAAMWGCSTTSSAAGKVTSWAASPAGQAALTDIGLAVNTAAALDPKAGPALGAAGLAVRSLETAQAPSAADLATAIGEVTGNQTVAAKVAPAAAAMIASATANGVTPAAATEAAAVQVDGAAKALSQANP